VIRAAITVEKASQTFARIAILIAAQAQWSVLPYRNQFVFAAIDAARDLIFSCEDAPSTDVFTQVRRTFYL
jgi:hypothetical protein